MAIEWDEDTMSTGLEEIDNQHKEWMRHLNEFEEAIVNGQGKESLISTLHFLKKYTNIHFTTEENAMALLKIPALEQNKLAHEEFRGKLAEISDWVNQEGVSSVEILELKMDLEEWITNHICTVDIHLRDANQAGASISLRRITDQ